MSKKNKKDQSWDENVTTQVDGDGSKVNTNVDNGELNDSNSTPDNSNSGQSDKDLHQTQAEQAAQRITDLEAQLADARTHGPSSDMLERIAFLEGKLKVEQSEEQLYQERKAKYQANVAARKDKEARKKQALADIENGD